jgi:hypothetical protein
MELSSDSSAIEGFLGSIGASAFASELDETIADEDGWLALWAAPELVKSEQAAAIVTQESTKRSPNAGFTAQLDADPSCKVVRIRRGLPHPRQTNLLLWHQNLVRQHKGNPTQRGRRPHAF